jgi:hypothetical protein
MKPRRLAASPRIKDRFDSAYVSEVSAEVGSVVGASEAKDRTLSSGQSSYGTAGVLAKS